MKLESYHSTESKHQWKIVRTDSYEDVDGEIVSADEDTGDCCVEVGSGEAKQTKTLNLGPLGIRVVARRR